ncbi:unnamed protein product (macronuclear) [Paramecium tetraurelia]|uniref:Tetratricopeptide repeat protein n=1 Tax=Paramecium tetraurelia TaxID=5888 RepID=A0C8M0_PARTE|nr:uncharacterized protein GSPATT00036271001 [Paramecium tetraurelia]CAK67137.1 unnamed protein product [Paramecium tetraurelia]|eukprot:XP_001434534.1 hypothetical protein (macronuclear) [Paramecium tetraurelia strain d4-2]
MSDIKLFSFYELKFHFPLHLVKMYKMIFKIVNELNIQGKYDETLEQLDKNIENNKNNITLYMKKSKFCQIQIAQLLAKLGKLQEILNTWDLGILNNAHDLNFYQEKGKTCFSIYQPKLQGIKVNKTCSLNYMIMQQHKMSKMLRFISQNVKKGVSQSLGRELFEQKRFTEILECWDYGINHNKEHKIFYIQKIISIKNLYTQNDGLITDEGWRKIAECWNLGIMYNNNDHSFYMEKAQALEKLGEYEEVLACLDLGLKHNKYQLLLYKKKGQILEKMGKEQEIIDNYDKAISLMKHPGIYVEKANALIKQQKWHELIEFCSSDKQKEYNYFFLVKNLIQALSELERQEEIIKVCEEHIHRNDMFIYKSKGQIIIQNLANALLKQGLLNEAIQSWDEAIRINNNLQEYQIEKSSFIELDLVNALKELHRYPEALQICNYIISLELTNQIEMQNLKCIKNYILFSGYLRETRQFQRGSKDIKNE